MKPLIKTFGGYLNESDELSPEDQQELGSMGFSDKTPLDNSSDIIDAIKDRFYGDEEVRRLSAELMSRLRTLCEEFSQEYDYSDEHMVSASEQLSDWAYDGGDTLSNAIANAVYQNLS